VATNTILGPVDQKKILWPQNGHKTKGGIMSNIGDRVGAVLSGDEKSVKFIGFGKYVGEAVPNEAVGFMADALKENEMTNPKIELDNGEVVYGCECWWGSEESVKEMLEGMEVIDTPPSVFRKDQE